MKALILNSGMGTRMSPLTDHRPKCLTEISPHETILSRQLRMLLEVGITEIVITTGPFDGVIQQYCKSLELPVDITFVKNPDYQETNYIYSIYLAREYLTEDVILLHGDLVFENTVLDMIMEYKGSCVTVSSSARPVQKDFKAVLQDGRITNIGVEFFPGSNVVACQPLYLLCKKEWLIWISEIIAFCEAGRVGCYAENAFNQVADKCCLCPLDIRDMLCAEVDDPEDLAIVTYHLRKVQSRVVYMCFSADMLHSGHIAIIKKAQRLGKLMIGVLSDEAVASYKRFPLLPYEERRAMLESISGVYRVVEQRTLSYKENLEVYRPDFLVHGDDWTSGFQKPVRDEAVSVLASYGGKLVEFPYARNETYRILEDRARADLSLPDIRRARLRKMLAMKGTISVLEAHNGITGLIAEKTVVYQNGEARQFDAMWVSSLCDSVAKGKPDMELVDMTSRFQTIDDILEVTTKPIIFDGDTGGLAEHFVYTVRSLERIGVSMIIIEDKIGLKKNSLFGKAAHQLQDSIENFSAKIDAGKRAQKTRDFMICARIESLILERGMEDALRRAFAFREAGADAIMIHSRRKDPEEIFTFVERFRRKDPATPLVVVPTSFYSVTEEEWKQKGVNIVIYANQLTRSGFPAMQKAAELILAHHRAQECDEICMPIQEIITLIPERP